MIVFESMFGNTREIAEAVAAALAERMDIELMEVADAPTVVPGEVDLLVVGGPTHALGMSRPSTRQDAARQLAADAEHGSFNLEVVSRGDGIREWLANVDLGRPAPTVAVFDTKVRSPLPGSAASKAARLLSRRGTNVVGRRSFYVTGTQGPLRDGERDQARIWASELAELPAAGRTPRAPAVELPGPRET
ncbi:MULTISPECIES: hypothetical protein [unclassified Frankia]|uniref:hypothetical protein n=1 Tax=unclassified Frankia TaxID=2632575 RepID=UPI0019320255|nr:MULTISPECIES: hypothetical protein [unclassified Frankia]